MSHFFEIYLCKIFLCYPDSPFFTKVEGSSRIRYICTLDQHPSDYTLLLYLNRYILIRIFCNYQGYIFIRILSNYQGYILLLEYYPTIRDIFLLEYSQTIRDIFYQNIPRLSGIYFHQNIPRLSRIYFYQNIPRLSGIYFLQLQTVVILYALSQFLEIIKVNVMDLFIFAHNYQIMNTKSQVPFTYGYCIMAS